MVYSREPPSDSRRTRDPRPFKCRSIAYQFPSQSPQESHRDVYGSGNVGVLGAYHLELRPAAHREIRRSLRGRFVSRGLLILLRPIQARQFLALRTGYPWPSFSVDGAVGTLPYPRRETYPPLSARRT